MRPSANRKYRARKMIKAKDCTARPARRMLLAVVGSSCLEVLVPISAAPVILLGGLELALGFKAHL